MLLEPVQYLLGALSGSLVGLSLGLFGGGSSILAVPLMVYVVGVPAPHVEVGTSAFAVAANAAGKLLAHARRGNIIWRCAFIYSAAGILGAFVGSGLGKSLDAEDLLFLFALLMGVVGVLMFPSRGNPGTPGATCNREKAPKVLAYGAATGAFSSFSASAGVSSSCPASSPRQAYRSSTPSAPRSSPSRPSASPPQSAMRFRSWSIGRWRPCS
jgi:uncharacterized membrane protein YfcA